MLKLFAIFGFAMVCALTFPGCTHFPKDTASRTTIGLGSYKPIVREDVTTYSLTSSESATVPELSLHSTPKYPKRLVPLGLPPVDILAQLIMDENGTVTDVRFTGYPGDDRYKGRFEQSVKDAALTWKFSPFIITRTALGEDQLPVAVRTPKPFSLWYVFHFEIKDGVPASSISTKR